MDTHIHEQERFFSVEYETEGERRYFSFRSLPEDADSLAEKLMKEKPGAEFIRLRSGLKVNVT